MGRQARAGPVIGVDAANGRRHHAAMAQLGYFSANDPAAFVRRPGRVLAAGVLLLLCGLGVGAIAAWAGYQALRWLPSRIRFEEMLFSVTPSALSAAMLAAGFGLLARRRWSRPVGLVVVSTWLTYGVTIAVVGCVGVAATLARNGLPWITRDPQLLFWRVVVPLGMLAMLTVGLPALLVVLLRPDDVRRTLELHDPRPRWTDGRSVRRGVIVANFASLGGVLAYFCYTDWGYYWSDRENYLVVPCLVAAGLALAAAALVASGRRITDAAAFVAAVIVVALLAYVGVAPHPYLREIHSDRASALCVFVVVDATAAMLNLREMRATAVARA